MDDGIIDDGRRSPLQVLSTSNQFFDSLSTGIVLQNAKGTVIDCNESALAILGATREELKVRATTDAAWNSVREDGTAFAHAQQPAQVTLRTGEPCSNVIMGTSNVHQARKWVTVNTCRVLLEDGGYGVVSSFEDVTTLLKKERCLQLLTEASRVVMSARDEKDCLQELCNVLVTKGQYVLAWIGVTSGLEAGGVDIAHAAGATDYLFEGMVSWWGSGASGLGPTGTALRTGEVQVVQDLAHNAAHAPWRERAAQFNLGSSLAIPLAFGERRAVLNVYDHDYFAFDDVTVQGLVALAREAEFSISYVRSMRQNEVALEETTDAVAALKEAQRSLTEAGKWFRTLMTNSNDMIIVLDDQARITYANPSNIRIFGYGHNSQLGHNVFELIHPDDHEAAAALFAEAMSQPGPTAPVVIRFRTISGEWLFIESILTNCLDDPAIRGIVGNGRDVSERTYLTRALQTLTYGNQVLIHATDEASLLDEVCQTIVTSGGFSLAWVGFLEHDEDQGIRIVASGGATEYLNNQRFSWGDNEFGRGPIGMAVKTGEVQIINDVASSSLMGPWRVRATEFGFKAGCVFPLNVGGETIGALAIYSNELGSVGPDEVATLSELAAELAYGIGRLRDAENLARNEELLRDVEQRFRLAFQDNMSPMLFVDLEDRAIEVNDAFCKMMGFEREELLGSDSQPFTLPEDLGITESAHRQLSAGEADQVRYVKRYQRKDGRVIVVEVLRSAVHDEAGNILYFVISQRDITDLVQRDHILGLLTQVSKLAMVASSESDFFQRLCEALVDDGGYALAWIGVAASGDEGGVELLCAAGETDYLPDRSDPWWGSRESGAGPPGTAMRTGISQVDGDLTDDSLDDVWHRNAARFGFGSSVSIPDRIGSQRAVLNMYHRYVLAFDEKLVAGLEEIVREVEFAVTHVRSVRKTEKALEETTVAVNALKVSDNARTRSEQRFRLAFEQNTAPMVFSDLEDRVIAVNDAFCRMIGFSREELIGEDSKQFTHPDDIGITEETLQRLTSDEVDQVRYVKRYLRKDGRVIVSEVSRTPARDANGKILYFVASERDVTDERALTEQLFHQALHDPLTGLANRALFEDRLSHAHAKTIRQGGFGAVLLLDLDDFKGVNDTHGHLVGDQLLVGIARRFELVTRSSDTLSRFGGDEFLYLAEGMTSAAEAEEVAIRLLDVLVEPFTFDGLNFEQRASIGIVVWDATVDESSDAIQNADIALYEAKRQGKGRFVVFTPSMQQTVVSRFTLVQELRQALHSGELSMHYQPIVSLTTTEVVGFEALMRWQHPERGMVPPATFIALAEESELILELGAFALNSAVNAASSWASRDDQAAPPYVSVNLSAHQFQDPNLVGLIEDALRSGGLAPERLVIEITESTTLLDAVETLNVMERLKELGVEIALDDFGTGYSSLSYLVRLHPKIIKIDQYFVSPSFPGAQNDALLETIVSLGNKLGMTMVAEGIETREQYEILRDLNCGFGQGFYFSRAVPKDEAALMVGKEFRF
jgi:diguanylate cyclase (GGDEF)-like protein/PAS domain S-box-containing protein